MLGLARAFTGGSVGQMDNRMPLGGMHQLGDLAEASNIQNLAKMPAFGQWNQKLALKAEQQAATAKTRVLMGKQAANAYKSQIDSAVEATKVRLDVKAHGMNAAAKVANEFAGFREKTLQAHNQVLTAQARVTGMEKAMNQSESLIAL